MHNLLPRIGEIAEKIKGLEESREKLGLFLRAVRDKVDMRASDVLEGRLVYAVSADSLSGRKIASVDGGLSQREYHGLDLILTRAVAVICDYERKLSSVAYFPDSLVTPSLIVLSDPYSEEEFSVSSSLERQRGEVELASRLFGKFGPDVVLMDGSIVPHGNDRPSSGSLAYSRYKKVIESFKELYKSSSGSLLAGCVEDSRGRRFCEIVSERILSVVDNPRVEELQKILSGTRDTNLLFHALQVGERTCVFKFSKNYKEHLVLSDLGEFGGRIYCFYLKTAEFDRPLRVDFYSERDPVADADRIASLVLATSCHSSYGCPAPLIEADFRAKLSENDVNSLHDQLVDRVGITPSLMKLRREQRPF